MSSDACPGPLDLVFDPCTPWGAKEHYFHFLHGYLLPGLSLALDRAATQVRFEDCGPLMLPRIAEACALLSLELAPPMSADTPLAPPVSVPRWDRLLLRFDAPPHPARVMQAYATGAQQIRQKLLNAARHESSASGNLERWREVDVIVFERSQEHAFYRTPQMKRTPGYGRGRRSLENSHEIAAKMRTCGLRAIALDLGALSLSDQIMAFHHARAVIGIRGAEFANLIWMRPGSIAMMLADPVKHENHGARSLAGVFGIHFSSPKIAAAQVEFPPIRAATLIREAIGT